MPDPAFHPTPFPTRAFIAIGTVWVLVDMAAIVVILNSRPYYYGVDQILMIAWSPTILARMMLMLGWWILGEGAIRQRVAGVILFAPLLIPPLTSAIREPEVLFGLPCILIGTVLALPVVALPYLCIRGADYQLGRDTPRVEEKHSQFTVRQLMFLTLLAAVVMGLLRWARESDMKHAVFGLLWPLLGWLYPLAATLGLLQLRWYPGMLYVAGATVYLLALPSCTLGTEEAIEVSITVASYTLCFAGHLLLLRRLGFRLVHAVTLIRRHDLGIEFLEWTVRERGIEFIEPDQRGIEFVRDVPTPPPANPA